MLLVRPNFFGVLQLFFKKWNVTFVTIPLYSKSACLQQIASSRLWKLNIYV